MQCPKCKNLINGNSLKCDKCGAKVAAICKDCGTINPINAQKCSKCGKTLLKICADCGAANFPEAKSCRKCGYEFIQSKVKIIPDYTPEMSSQQKVKTVLTESIKNGVTSVITLNGESGTGKNLVLRYVISDLKNANIIWLWGCCTQVTQMSPFGYFQDLLLKFFNVNNFCPNTFQLRKNSMKFFRQDFPTLENSEILDLLNLLYPESIGKFEHIYLNKSKMFVIMKKVIMTIIEKVKTVFVIDNFEYIDGMSHDFLQELLKDAQVIERAKFVILSKSMKPGMGCITSKHLSAENYTDLTIAPFSETQIEALIAQYPDIETDNEFIKHAVKVSGGIPAVVEQVIMLYQDIKRDNLRQISYNSFESIVDARLGILKHDDITAYKFLIAMSVLGSKFYPAMLEGYEGISGESYERIIDTLVRRGYITQLDNLSFEFKCFDLWKSIVSIVKNDELFEEVINTLYEILNSYKQSSLALLAYIVQKLNNNDQSFDIWTLLMKQAAYIGDVALYIIAQKQCLKLIEHKNSQYFIKIKKNIYTRVGKLLEPIDHVAAFEYLHNAVLMLEDDEEYEHVDLLGYLASASMKNGNYWGAIECADEVLNKLPPDMEPARTLVKSREIKPLVCLGNYGQAVNMVDNEIMPVLEDALSRGRNIQIVSQKELFDIWLSVYFDLAEALTFRGENRMFDIIKLIFDIITKYKVTDEETLCKAHLALALANTVRGNITTSETILEDILKEYSFDELKPILVSRWNFIDILNKYMKKDYDSVMSELFNVVAYANNSNDDFTKNILKTILAQIMHENGDTKRALEILDEQVAYFAKEKIATGVLLSWYLIAKIKLVTKGTQYALDIATKALDIAQKPDIGNYYFACLFNRLIGEIYVAKQDFDSAKVYIEKSIFMSKQFNLEEMTLKNYIQYAKMYQEQALPKSSMRGEYIKQAIKMFQAAKNMSIADEQPHLQRLMKFELGVLTSFCKLNGIVLKKSK